MNVRCQVCGENDDCRPYGKNGALVCFDCGMMDEDEAMRQFSERMGSGPLYVVGNDIVKLSRIASEGKVLIALKDPT